MCEMCGNGKPFNFLEGIEPDEVPEGANYAEMTVASERYNAALHARCVQMFYVAFTSGLASAAISAGNSQAAGVEWAKRSAEQMVADPIARLQIEEGVKRFLMGEDPSTGLFSGGGDLT